MSWIECTSCGELLNMDNEPEAYINDWLILCERCRLDAERAAMEREAENE